MKKYKFKHYKKISGTLVPFSLSSQIPFKTKRIFIIYGNKNFAKLIESSECEIGSGTDCGATVARMMSKGIQVFRLGLELNSLFSYSLSINSE